MKLKSLRAKAYSDFFVSFRAVNNSIILPDFKAKVALEALRETEPLEALAQKYGVAPSKITEWKNELLNNADKAFGKDSESKSELKKVTAEKERLLKKVGQLTITKGLDSITGIRHKSRSKELSMPAYRPIHGRVKHPRNAIRLQLLYA